MPRRESLSRKRRNRLCPPLCVGRGELITGFSNGEVISEPNKGQYS